MPRRCQRFHALDEIAKIRNHFRRASCEIYDRNVRVRKPIDDPISRLSRHDFLALRPGVHMAMHAGEIAKLAHVDLQDFRAPAAKRERTFGKPLGESIHCKSAATAAVATTEKVISFCRCCMDSKKIHERKSVDFFL